MKNFIKKKTIRKLIKQMGVKRISDDAIEKIINYLKEKSKLIVKDCLEYSKFYKRNTLLKKDIELWIKKKSLKRF
ncbi:MAG: NFYB/HAP3 family transcription factor subunit [Candidatus Aenigmatarchaeota archaeon]